MPPPAFNPGICAVPSESNSPSRPLQPVNSPMAKAKVHRIVRGQFVRIKRAGGMILPENVLCLSEKLPDPTNSVEIKDWVAADNRPPAPLGLGNHETVEGIAMHSRQIAHPHCV